MSSIADITGELVTYLTGQTYSISVDFSNTIISRKKIEDLGTGVTGTVYPATNTRERQDRTGFMTIYGVMIAVSKKLNEQNDTEVEDLMTLCEEIALSTDNVNLASGRIMNATIDPIFDFERLNEMNVFTSMIQLEIKGR